MRTRFLKTCNRDSLLVFSLLAVAITLRAAQSVPCEAQTVNRVHVFFGDSSAYPSTLTQGRDGKLYGSAIGRSVFGFNGEVFDITTAGDLTAIHLFDLTQGSGPTGGVLLSTDGAFYGTTPGGGSAGQFGYGVLYRLTPSGAFAIIHEFAGDADGAYPWAAPIEASDGKFPRVTVATAGHSRGVQFGADGMKFAD